MRALLSVSCAVLLAGCATTSDVMEAEGGTYIISAQAAPARGGAAGANDIAFKKAKEFCASKGLTAIAVDAADRDVYQSSGAGSWNSQGGNVAGATFAAGNASLRFRCK